MTRSISIAAIGILVLAAACGSSSNRTTTTPATANPHREKASTTTTVTATSAVVLRAVMNAKVNQNVIIDAASGKIVYEYIPDGTSTTSKVPANLHSAWPAVTTLVSHPTCGKGLDDAKVKVNAAHQVSYGGHLLYTFAGDTGPGTANGQALGGVWYVLSTNGAPVMS